MALADARAAGHVAATHHTRGAGAARVTLVVYGDHECPPGAQAYPIVQEVDGKLLE
jgi:hypothetical protein